MQPDLDRFGMVPTLARPRALHLRLLLAVLGILSLGFKSDISGQTSAPSQPSVTRGAAAIDIPFETFTLPNGLRVVVHTDRKAPIVAVNIWYHVGSKDEPAGRSGLRAPLRAPDVQRLGETTRANTSRPSNWSAAPT